MQCIVAYCYKYTTYDLFCGPGLQIYSLWNLLAIRVNIFLFQFFPQCILSLFAHMPKKKQIKMLYIMHYFTFEGWRWRLYEEGGSTNNNLDFSLNSSTKSL